MVTATKNPRISGGLRESILDVAKNEATLTRAMVIQAETEGLSESQLTEIVTRVRRRLEAISVLDCMNEREARLNRAHQNLQLCQQLHKMDLDAGADRETLKERETRWVELSIEWQGLFTSLLEDDKKSVRAEAEETLRSTAPLDLAEQCRDAHCALLYLQDLLTEAEEAARLGQIPVSNLEKLRQRVQHQEGRVAMLDKQACDPTVLI